MPKSHHTRLLCLLALSAVAHEARAHPAPFSYLDLHLDAERTGGTLVIHDFDAAYELRLEDPQALLEPGVAQERADELLAIVAERLRIVADGEPATLQWRQVTIVTAFTMGPSLTLSLAALDLVRVAPALVEPAIALSIVVVGGSSAPPDRGDGPRIAVPPSGLRPPFVLGA